MCDVRILSVCPSEEDRTIPLFSISINGRNCEKLLTKEEAGNYIRGEMLKTSIKKHEELKVNINIITKYFIQSDYNETKFEDGINIFDTDAINGLLNIYQLKPW